MSFAIEFDLILQIYLGKYLSATYVTLRSRTIHVRLQWLARFWLMREADGVPISVITLERLSCKTNTTIQIWFTRDMERNCPSMQDYVRTRIAVLGRFFFALRYRSSSGEVTDFGETRDGAIDTSVGKVLRSPFCNARISLRYGTHGQRCSTPSD